LDESFPIGYQTLIGDLIVQPDYQQKGIATTIMNLLIEKCKEHSIKSVQLFSALGKTEFYKKLGFNCRPEDGPGMQRFLDL
jgi:N-acetylglutamate synthase-like GNAT family acetyltransferase